MATDELNVWLGQQHVASLLRTRSGELRLRYTEAAVHRFGENSVVMSVALPISRRRYKGLPVEYWAESLLPEGETRTTIEQRFGVRRGDTFGLLAAIGADCAGAVSFLPGGASPTEDLDTVKPLSPDELDEALDRLPTHPLGVDDEVRVSLGGLQAKLLLTRTTDGRWGRPAAGTPSTHIVKPDPPAFPGLVVAEAFSLALAAAADITASEYELVTWGGRTTLVLRRFDRVVRDGKIVRLHQEDGCAVLGVNPTNRHKYQSADPDSPSLVRLARVLSTHGADPRTDLSALAAAVTVRVAVGDTDGHARNYGLLHTGHTVALAPLYDVASTGEFVTAKQVGLWVGGQPYLSAITSGHLVQEFTSWGLPARFAASLPTQILVRLREALPSAHQAVPQVRDGIVRAVRRRIDRLLASP